jgi:hypothetical protein
MIETTAFHTAKDAIDQALCDARREYRELGTSLRIANEEREHLGDMLEAAFILLARPARYAGEAAAESAVSALAIEIALERKAREGAMHERMRAVAS